MSSIPLNETFWVGISFFLFFALLWKLGIFKMMASSLDGRANRIKAELDDARKIKEEAQALLASYQRKHHKAEEEAAEIINHAKQEAEQLLSEATKTLESEISKRTELAQQKIAQAEASVIQQIRENAVDVTVGAARALILERLNPEASDAIIQTAISDLGRKFH